MYKNFTLTESEKEQILSMHKEHGYKKPLNEWEDQEIHYGADSDDDDDMPYETDDMRRQSRDDDEYRELMYNRKNRQSPEDRIGTSVSFDLDNKKYEGTITHMFKEDNGDNVFIIKYFEDNGTPRMTGLKQGEFTMDDYPDWDN